MRFMTIVFAKDYENAKPGWVHELKSIKTMRKYKEQLQELLALDGLTPAIDDERASYIQNRKIESYRRPVYRSVGSGRRLLGDSGEVAPRALEWASRIPGKDNEMVEVSPVVRYKRPPCRRSREARDCRQLLIIGWASGKKLPALCRFRDASYDVYVGRKAVVACRAPMEVRPFSIPT